MNAFTEVLLIGSLSLAAAVGTHFYHPKAPAWYLYEAPIAEGEVTMEHIHQKFHDNVLWIDARSPADFELDHIPSAILIHESDLESYLYTHLETIQNNEKPIVVYCSSSSCQASHKLRDYLKERIALEEIYVLQGGWEAYQEHLKTHKH